MHQQRYLELVPLLRVAGGLGLASLGVIAIHQRNICQAGTGSPGLGLSVDSQLIVLHTSQPGMIQSRSLSGRHVSTSFLDPVLGAMMKQVCWHSRRSKAYRGLPEARMAASRLRGACVGQAVVCRASSLHLSLLRQKK